MSAEQIGEVFGFNPERNIDFQKMAQLFEVNARSDPQLIAQFLQPELVASLYSKGSSARVDLLNKLVEKGKRIDPKEILKIYGEDGRQGDKKSLAEYKYNNTDSNFNLLKIEEDSELGFKKMDSNMSRTDGVAGFLSPIHVTLAKGRGKVGQRGSLDDLSDEEEVTEYNRGEGGSE
jgi:hypothetical protein